MRLIPRIKTNLQLREQVKDLTHKVNDLNSLIEDIRRQRKKDGEELKKIFNDELSTQEENAKNGYKTVLDRQTEEIAKLKGIIEDNRSVVEAARDKSSNIEKMETEAANRLKLAGDFFNQGLQQLRMIFDSFSEYRKDFDTWDIKKAPKLKYASNNGKGK